MADASGEAGSHNGRPNAHDGSGAAEVQTRTTPHTAELLRALLNRIDSLEDEFNDLIGRRGEGGRSGEVAALRELRGYPDHMRRLATAEVSRGGRPDPLASKLRGHSESVVTATRKLQGWFAAPYSDDVPVALLNAVEHTCRGLDIGPRRAVIAVGPPTRIETVVTDVRRALYRPEVPPASSPDRAQFALLTIPRHEGRSPRWWPVVLGHEMSHLRIRHLSVADQAGGGQAEGLPDDLGSSSSVFFMLQKAGILTHFPFADMRAAHEADAEDRSRTSTELAGLTPQAEALDDREPAEPGTTALAKSVAVANNWATEIVCDLVMARRFGPAAVAAIGTYLTAIGDFAVISKTHPPGHLRIRLISRYLADGMGPVLAAVLEPWLTVGGAAEDADPAWVKVLSAYLEGSFDALVREVDGWPGERYACDDPARERAVVLAQRQLCFGLPPHDGRLTEYPPGRAEGLAEADEHDPSDVAEFLRLTDADVINAGWAVMTATEPLAEGGARDLPFDRLVLKALEDQQLVAAIAAAGEPTGEPTTESISAAPAGLTGGAVLGRAAIRARLEAVEPAKRLIVTPMLPGTLGKASADLRLGTRFIIFQRTSTTSFNALKGNNPREVQRLIERGWGTPFVLHPGEVVLASALEYIALPHDLSAQVITRSSYGRLGLITATAAQVHPSYRGCLTLELVNLGTVPLELYPGERVAQLIFLSVDKEAAGSTPSGAALMQDTYACPTGPEFPNVSVDPWVKRVGFSSRP